MAGDASSPTPTVRPDGLLWIGSQRQFADRLRAGTDAHAGAERVVVDLGRQPAIDAAVVDVLTAESAHLAQQGTSMDWINAPEGADELLIVALRP